MVFFRNRCVSSELKVLMSPPCSQGLPPRRRHVHRSQDWVCHPVSSSLRLGVGSNSLELLNIQLQSVHGRCSSTARALLCFHLPPLPIWACCGEG